MLGVTVSQQPPPGWLTSTMPSNPLVPASSTGSTGVDVATTLPARITCTYAGTPRVYPLADTKSRAGNEMTSWPGAGGSAAMAGVATAADVSSSVPAAPSASFLARDCMSFVTNCQSSLRLGGWSDLLTTEETVAVTPTSKRLEG